MQTTATDQLNRMTAMHAILIEHQASSIEYPDLMPLIAKLAENDLTEQRSRFYAAAVPAATLDEVKKEIARRKKRYHKARHHCWACRVRDENGRLVEQARDDGEVGKPGMKLLELLRSHDLEGLLVVSRIFGGVKLGPGGVGRAFKAAALGAIEPNNQ